MKMLPFDYDKAKTGHPVCTRVGKNVEEIFFSEKQDSPFAIIVRFLGESEFIPYRKDGKVFESEENQNDLFLVELPKQKKEGWVNIKSGVNGASHDYLAYAQGEVFRTKEEADAGRSNFGIFLDCVKIEWAE